MFAFFNIWILSIKIPNIYIIFMFFNFNQIWISNTFKVMKINNLIRLSDIQVLLFIWIYKYIHYVHYPKKESRLIISFQDPEKLARFWLTVTRSNWSNSGQVCHLHLFCTVPCRGQIVARKRAIGSNIIWKIFCFPLLFSIDRFT